MVRVEVVHPRCAGIDVSKSDAKVCVRVQGSGRRPTKSTVTTWGAMSNQILALREHLVAREGHLRGDGTFRLVSREGEVGRIDDRDRCRLVV